MKLYELFSEDESFDGPKYWEEKALMKMLKSLENLKPDAVCFLNSTDSYEKPSNIKVDYKKQTVFLSGAGGLDIGAAFGWALYEEEKVVTTFNRVTELAWHCDEYISLEVD